MTKKDKKTNETVESTDSVDEVDSTDSSENLCPWCEAVLRLNHADIRSVRVHGGLLFATVLNDHVEVNLGAYGG